MFNILVRFLRTVVATWLLKAGCQLEKWAPGAALFHYLEGTGEDLDISHLPHVREIAAIEIAIAISFGKKKGNKVYCNYYSNIPMQTPVPYLGAFLDGRFNELTASVGGFTAVLENKEYKIVDRYDWYNVYQGVDIPPVIGKHLGAIPKQIKSKLGLISKPNDWWVMNQANLVYVGKSFNTLLRVPEEWVLSVSQEEVDEYSDKTFDIDDDYIDDDYKDDDYKDDDYEDDNYEDDDYEDNNFIPPVVIRRIKLLSDEEAKNNQDKTWSKPIEC